MAGTLTISTLSDGTYSTSSTNLVRGTCVAWVNCNGTNGATSIRASYNVSSVTQNYGGLGSAAYGIAFTNALSDANYSWVAGMSSNSAGVTSTQLNNGTTAPTTSVAVVTCYVSVAGANPTYLNAVFFR